MLIIKDNFNNNNQLCFLKKRSHVLKHENMNRSLRCSVYGADRCEIQEKLIFNIRINQYCTNIFVIIIVTVSVLMIF